MLSSDPQVQQLQAISTQVELPESVPPLVYYVDIDGTICNNSFGDYTKAVPYPERIAKLNNLYDEGVEIIYWTARGAQSGKDWAEFTKAQLALWGAKYTRFIPNKPHYNLWIDDKAVNANDFFN